MKPVYWVLGLTAIGLVVIRLADTGLIAHALKLALAETYLLDAGLAGLGLAILCATCVFILKL